MTNRDFDQDDECELCEGTEVIKPDNTHNFPCPRCVEIDYMYEYKKILEYTDCTDESEDYDDPKPEELQRVHWRRTPVEVQDYIHDLQSELQDVREELFYKENYIQRLRERLNNVRNALRNNQENN